jgi:hypothetical protein
MTEPATTAKPRKETWLDWVAPVPEDEAIERAQPLLKADELIAALAAEGIKATRRELFYWQSIGALPFPIKQRIGQAAWALYPTWAIDLIRLIRIRQGRGWPENRPDNIAEVARSTVRRTFGQPVDGDERHELETKAAYRRYRAHLKAAAPLLESAAKEFEQATGAQIGRVEIAFHRPPEDGFTRIDVINPDDSGAPVWWRLKDAPNG